MCFWIVDGLQEPYPFLLSSERGTQAYILTLFEPNPNLWPGSILCLCERGRIPAPGVAYMANYGKFDFFIEDLILDGGLYLINVLSLSNSGSLHC